MSLWRRLRQGVFVLTRREQADRELLDEVAHFFDEQVNELVAGGMTPAEARRITRLRLGEPGSVREDVRAAAWEMAPGTVLQDLRLAVRRLRRNPGFTVVTVLTLALGIGASTTVFSAARPVLFEPLPYPDADRVVTIQDRTADGIGYDVTFGTYREFGVRSRSFETLAVMRPWQPVLTGRAEPERLDAQRVSAAFLRTLGVAPVAGRDFAESDDRPGAANVVVLSHGLWQRRFNGEHDVVGRPIVLDDRPHTVIGIMPATFENVLSPSAELWVPLKYDPSLPPDGREWGHHLRMTGRLRGGVAVADAKRELDRIAATPVSDIARVPWAALEHGLLVNPLRDDVAGPVRPALLAIIGAVALLLVIACVNVTSLLLAHGARRRGEMAVRAALGAGRGRLVAQLFVEGVLLACIGAAAGIAVARLGLAGLIALSPPDLPRLNAIRLDGPVFFFAVGVTTAIGVIVGTFVALYQTRRGVRGAAVQHSTRLTGAGTRARRALVVVEISLAVILLVAGGLLVRSMERLLDVDPGYEPDRVVTMRVQVSPARYATDDAVRQYFERSLEAVRAVPGVASAGYTSLLPLTGDYFKFGVFAESAPDVGADEDGSAFRYAVTPGYLETMRIPLRSGRLLSEHDARTATASVLINESFARRRFPDAHAVGQRIRLGGAGQPWSTVVGVVADVKQLSLAEGEQNAVYLAAAQTPFADRVLWLVARTRGDPAVLAPTIRETIWSVDADQSVSDIATMRSLIVRSAAARRFTLIIMQTFALSALLLAAVGLYGVLAGSVAERVREIGVRSALGATRIDIGALIFRQAFALAGLGLIIGIAGALVSTRLAESLLFGVSRLDAVTYAGVPLLLLAVCACATLIPAWRAARIDPAVTLRSD
ncbi:MAG TPA: ABC transporter permease [Longimicrobiales bacterium]|nr:ABC transporter permease [Longimicrobiales bacterium]